MDQPRFKAIVGLSNPGAEYSGTFHNAGEIAVEFLSQKDAFQKKVSFAYQKNHDVILIKSLVFMNESGKAVAAALRFFKINSQEVLIAHDDADILLGNYRLSYGKRSAGHKGVESVIQVLGTKNFWRLRIGIRKKAGKAGSMVLKRIPEQDQESIYEALAEFKKNVIEKETP